mgnify:CR=1 FL=1
MAIPLSWFLILAGALFCIGLYGALSRKNAIGILMGIELMLNAVNVNLVAFWRYGVQPMVNVDGQVFAIFVMAVAAAEVAVGLALIVAIFHTKHSINVDNISSLKG